MASVYKVKNGQNVFDVAVQIYGSIEGLFDLLMTNNISVNSKLEEGQELLFHEEFIRNQSMLDEINANNIVIKHGNGNQIGYHTIKNTRYVIKVVISSEIDTYAEFVSSGDGSFSLDWGDGKIGKAGVSAAPSKIGHEFRAPGTYSVKLYDIVGTIGDVHSISDNVTVYHIINKQPFIVGSSLVGGEDVVM